MRTLRGLGAGLLVWGLVQTGAAGAATKSFQWEHDGLYTTSYPIYRSTDNGATYTGYAEIPAPAFTWTDTQVPVNTPLCYVIEAKGPGGESGRSQPPVCFLVPPPPPTVPMNFRTTN